MEEKKYLKWYNKVGYGSGDIAGNVVYAFLSTFVLIYLTNTVGLKSGIVGTLIAVSKLFDGVTDVFFGAMIDKTKTKMGKARPWMLYGYIGCAVTLIAIFAIPENIGETAQYIWFFIAYSLLNAVFYTANNIAYSALTALITRNSKERVEMGSYRFIFAFSTSLLIQSVTIKFVSLMGGGAAGWRMVAIVYAVIGLAVNTISVLAVKELPEEEGAKVKKEEKYTQLEYIEGTGTQHINTEVKTKQSLKIECIFSGKKVSTLLFGARKTARLDGLAWGFNNTDYAFSGFGGSTQKNNTTVNTTDGKKHTVVLSNEVYTIDDVNQSLPNRGTFSNFYDIYLFTWNNANVVDTRKFKGKVYNFKIYDNNVLIRDMIPVLAKNGVACMYDKVNKEFYYNQGAGEFIAGPLENYFN